MRRVYPLPEAIMPGDWQIQEGQPRCELSTRKMWLVLQDDPRWATVRAHELAHVAFTPKTARAPRTVSMATLQATEDMRVNMLARRSGVDFSAGAPDHILKGAAFLAKDDLRAATLLLVSAFDDANAARILDLLKEAETKPAILSDAVALRNEAMSRMGLHSRRRSIAPWSYARTLKVAHWLDEQFAQRDQMQAANKPGNSRPTSKDSAGLPVGTMHIEQPALTANSKHRIIGTTDEGAVLRAPWRVTTDQRVFRLTKVPRNGSVLIDASGSMCLTAEDVQRIAAAVPAGIVAAYAGQYDSGALRILAKRGRVAGKPSAYNFGDYGSNVIDVPALDWLAAQPKPRVWISDGGVTGIGDDFYANVTARAAAIEHDSHITRCPNVAQAVKFLSSRR